MIQIINIGAAPNDKTGTPARQAGQMINENFAYLDARISNKDQIVTAGTFALVDNVLTIHAGWVWEINGNEYTNPADVVITFDYAETDNQRLDRIVCNTSNTFTKIPGTESETNPVAGPVPADTIEFMVVLVTDAVVGDPTPPGVGLTPNPVLIVATSTGINQEFDVPAGFVAGSVLKSKAELYKITEWTQAGVGLPVKILVNVNSGNTIYIKP